MATVNKQIIVGRLGKDVELKQSQNPLVDANGVPRNANYCYVGVATDHVLGKNEDGTWKTETTWHNVTVNGEMAERLAKNGRKGSLVYVEGRTQHKKDEKTGGYFTNVIASQITVLDSKDAGPRTEAKTEQTEQVDRGAAKAAAQQGTPTTEPAAVMETVPADAGSDLPF